MHLSLLLLLRHSARILLAQSPPDGARLLGSEIKGKVFLAGVELAESVTLVGVDDGEDTGDRFAEVVDSRQFRSSAASDLLHTQSAQLGLQLIELLLEVIFVLGPESAGLDARGGRLHDGYQRLYLPNCLGVRIPL